MKLKQEMVDYLAGRVVNNLMEKELIEVEDDPVGLVTAISAVITQDLQVEDDLNLEVKEVLEQMGDEIDNVDYRKMFQMVKHRYARERGLIL